MKFGIFYEHSVSRPWTDISEWRAYHQALEQICLADELGFDQVWEVEHHFLEEYSHSSAPEVFLSAAAAMTKNIHICQGIALCLPQINHPARIAERAAALDIISNGRLEFGTRLLDRAGGPGSGMSSGSGVIRVLCGGDRPRLARQERIRGRLRHRPARRAASASRQQQSRERPGCGAFRRLAVHDPRPYGIHGAITFGLKLAC